MLFEIPDHFFRLATVTKGVRRQTGGDMETIASRCKRRSGRRWRRRRRLNRRRNDIFATFKESGINILEMGFDHQGSLRYYNTPSLQPGFLDLYFAQSHIIVTRSAIVGNYDVVL